MTNIDMLAALHQDGIQKRAEAKTSADQEITQAIRARAYAGRAYFRDTQIAAPIAETLPRWTKLIEEYEAARMALTGIDDELDDLDGQLKHARELDLQARRAAAEKGPDALNALVLDAHFRSWWARVDKHAGQRAAAEARAMQALQWLQHTQAADDLIALDARQAELEELVRPIQRALADLGTHLQALDATRRWLQSDRFGGYGGPRKLPSLERATRTAEAARV